MHVKTARERRRFDRIRGIIVALLVSNGIASQLWLHTLGRGETWVLVLASLGGIIVAAMQILETRWHTVAIEREDRGVEETKTMLDDLKEYPPAHRTVSKIVYEWPIPIIRRMRGCK